MMSTALQEALQGKGNIPSASRSATRIPPAVKGVESLFFTIEFTEGNGTLLMKQFVLYEIQI